MDPSSRLRMKPLWGFGVRRVNFCWTMSKKNGWPKFGKMNIYIYINIREFFVYTIWCCDFAWVFAIISTVLLMFPLHVSNERHPCLRYVGDYTTQLYRDYIKPLIRIKKTTTRIQYDSMESKGNGTYLPSVWPLEESMEELENLCGTLGVEADDRDVSWRWKSEWFDWKNSVIQPFPVPENMSFQFGFWMWFKQFKWW